MRTFGTRTRGAAAGRTLACLVALRGSGATLARGLTVKGSDTMVILAQRWAESYMKSNKGKIVQVTGGGSGTGIAALINGTTDICMASRPMKHGREEEAARPLPVDGLGDPGREGRALGVRERRRIP